MYDSLIEMFIQLTQFTGNLIETASGLITTPYECAGGYIWKVVFYAVDNQYGCVTTGIKGHTIIYSLKIITGKCQSIGWTDKGYTKFNPPLNNLGAIGDYGNENPPSS